MFTERVAVQIPILLLKTMQNYKEQSPSSLNLLFRKQSLGAFSVITQGLIFHPFCVREYSEDKLEVISVSGSPFHRSSVGFCCCRGAAAVAGWAFQGELDTGTATIPNQGTRWGGDGRGDSQPLSPLPVHPQKGKIPNWASSPALKTTFHQLLFEKNPFLDSSTCSCPPWSSANTKTSLAPQ